MGNKTIIVGVAGGIAAYKALDVVSRLRKKGFNDIHVIMTSNACKFVTPLSFEAISGNVVYCDMFKEPKAWEIQHISLAKKADLIVVVPATANVIGKVSNGIADDMLTTTIMAAKCDVIFSPAMNVNMYENKIVQSNLNKLKQFGYEVIDPAEGRLACGDTGAGKLPAPEDIVETVCSHLYEHKNLVGKKVLVTAGPTIARIDPVRYITNNSSGKMGYELAIEARDRGADVVLISGPTNLKAPLGIEFVGVESTDEMYNEVHSRADQQDIIIKNAAVADFAPKIYSTQKIKKTAEGVTLELVKGKDILKDLGTKKRNQLLIGFAAESENFLENAKKKIEKKNLDYVFVNNIANSDIGFKSDDNAGYLISKDGEKIELPKSSKRELAVKIFENILNK